MQMFTHRAWGSLRPVRTFIFLLFFSFYCITAAAQHTTNSLAARVTLDLPAATLDDVLKQLDKQTPYNFSYDSRIATKISVGRFTYTNATLSAVFTALEKYADIAYQVEGSNISLRIALRKPIPAVLRKETGILEGHIVSEKGEPLTDATILVVEEGKTVRSSVDGAYSLSLPAGLYTVEVSFISYETKRVTGVAVKTELPTDLDIVLKSSPNTLGQVVVSSSFRTASVEGLYARQKNSASTLDGITRDQIQRTPDNNVAQVLRRVSGLHVQENKFVIIRGLSDRYNNVLLNGSMLPSTEPNRRNFAFDIVPSALMDNIVVHKTATPDLPGEFTGGVVEVTTRDIPTSDFIRFKAGTGFNTKTTGKTFYQAKRGRYDYFGFDDGGRQLPGSYEQDSYLKLIQTGENNNDPNSAAAREEYAKIGREFPNRFRLYNYTGRPLQDYELNLGGVKRYQNNKRLGGILAITYRNEQTAQDYIDDAPPENHYYAGTQYSFTTTLSALLNAAYSFGKNKISIKNTVMQKLNENTFRYTGKNLASGNDINSIAHFPLINTLLQNRLEGEHALGSHGLKLNWHGGYALTLRDEPDNLAITGTRQPSEAGGPYNYGLHGDNLNSVSYYFSKLRENRFTWSLDLQQPFTIAKQQQLLKIGYQGSRRKAVFDSHRFSINPDAGAQSILETLKGLPYYEVFDRENISPGKLRYYSLLSSSNIPSGLKVNGYEGSQQLQAGFAMIDGHIIKPLRVIAGVRAEKNEMNTHSAYVDKTGGGQFTDKDSLVRIDKLDWLPSANLIYALTNKINIRASYYHTVARPDIREMSFFQYYEPQVSAFTYGNSLRQSSIRNADLRFEYFPTPREVISVSGFYKKIKDPIELQVLSAQIASNIQEYQYKNLQSATDWGMEFNFRKSLDFVGKYAWLDRLFISGNFTWIDASVRISAAERRQPVVYQGNDAVVVYPAVEKRPLFGQASYVINGGLQYTTQSFGINMSYNRTGPRVIFGSDLPDYTEWEKPRDVVDLQLSYRFLKDKKAECRLNLSDLLNQPVIRYFNNYKAYYAANHDGIAPDASGTIHIPEDPSGRGYDSRYDYERRRFNFGRNVSISLTYSL